MLSLRLHMLSLSPPAFYVCVCVYIYVSIYVCVCVCIFHYILFLIIVLSIFHILTIYSSSDRHLVISNFYLLHYCDWSPSLNSAISCDFYHSVIIIVVLVPLLIGWLAILPLSLTWTFPCASSSPWRILWALSSWRKNFGRLSHSVYWNWSFLRSFLNQVVCTRSWNK